MPVMMVVGATSDIARSAALAFGLEGWDIQMAARDEERLARIADDLAVRLGRPVPRFPFDALDVERRRSFWKALPTTPDALLCAVGLLGDQTAARTDMDLAEAIAETNYSGLVPLLAQAAQSFEERGKGLIIVIASVAGDRGRASNYTYGAAKAALETYVSGLRQRLAQRGVQVITVKPGFVRTAMTEGMPLPELLTATPEQAAADIVRAARKKRSVVYTRWFWRWIMVIIKALPERLFQRLGKYL
jgi:short-subunit dehydrogenase